MSKSGFVQNWSAWRVVCSESHLVFALKRGYFMPPSLDAHAAFGADQQGLILVRRGEVPRRADEVRDSTGELGQPVSVRWTDEYLQAMLPELSSISSDRFEAAKGLALYSGGMRVGFVEHGRRIGLLAFLENSRLADALLPTEEVDHDLSNTSRHVSQQTQGGDLKTGVSRQKQPKLWRETPEPFDDDSLLETPRSKTRARTSRPAFVEPRILVELEREERLQCATELALEIAEDPVQLAFAASLARAERESWEDLGEDLRALCEYRVTRGSKNRRPISEIAAHIHELDQERRNSPMINSEKVELLRLAIKSKWGVSGQDLDHLSKVLSLVEADDSLGALNLSKMSSWVQGVVMFLLHSASPQEVLGISRSYFQVSPEAMSIAAFLVGLRFMRDSYNSESVFMPLRDKCVRSAVEILNDCVDEGNNLSITVEPGSIKFGEEKFVPARSMLVLDLEKCPVLVEDTRFGSMRLQAARIVIPLGAEFPRVKFQEIEDWATDRTSSAAEDFHSLVMGSVPRTKNKKRFLDFLENFTDYEKMFTKYQAVMLQFKGFIWVIDTGNVTHLFNSPRLFIRESRLIPILNVQSDDVENRLGTSARKKLERDLRKQLPKRFLERRERLEIPEK